MKPNVRHHHDIAASNAKPSARSLSRSALASSQIVDSAWTEFASNAVIEPANVAAGR